jgi:AcrR family transcriptional regulator
MPAGRPRAFDTDKALDAALRVFWKRGYEGASLPELTQAMGINRPSMYAAFGNKESLYKKAVERYSQGPACHLLEALNEPTAAQVAQRVMYGSVELITNPKNPPGCLHVHGILACGQDSDPVRKEMIAKRTEYEVKLTKRFERAKKEGDLPKSANPGDLAKFVCTITQGLAVRATSGATREELRKVVAIALQAWPT